MKIFWPHTVIYLNKNYHNNEYAGTAQCSSLGSLNPCGAPGNGYGCSSTNSSVQAFRVLTASFAPLHVAPTFQSLSSVVTKTAVSVSVVLGGGVEGSVYCAAYQSTQKPSAIADILLQDNVGSTTSSTATITINGLNIFTEYDVFCLAKSALGTLMTLEKVLQSKISIKTLCCKTLSINLGTIYYFFVRYIIF